MLKKCIIILIAASSIFLNLSSSLLNTIIYSVIIVPLAVMLGELTSNIAEYIGEKKGGLLAAAVGNIPELTMGIWSIKYGMIPLVKASLIGSIISNMLLVLGVSIFAGGIIYKEQKFNKMVARTNFSMLLLAMSAIIVVAAFKQNSSSISNNLLTALSFKISIVLIIVYILGLVFSLYTHSNLFVVSEESLMQRDEKKESCRSIAIQIAIISIILYFISEKLIFNLKETLSLYSFSQEFIGIILIPLLGNAGENFAAIVCALKNKINLSLEIAIGSSIQISLFVTPILIIIAYCIGTQMSLLFSGFQIIMAGIAVLMSFIVFQDGKTYWLEGAILISIYIVVTFAYYYLV